MRGSVGMEDQVVEAVVAVHDRRLVARRDGAGQPRDQPVHRLDLLGLGRAVLLRPAVDLAREVVAGLAEVVEADRLVVDAVQRAITRFISS